MSLVNPHPALKAAVPINPMVDVWKGDDWFHNGAFRQEMISYVYGQTANKKSDEEWFARRYDDYDDLPALRLGRRLRPRRWAWSSCPSGSASPSTPPTTNIGRTRRSTGSSPRQPLTVPTLFVDSEWDQEDIYGAPAVFNAVKASPNAHLVARPLAPRPGERRRLDARPARLGLGHRQMVPRRT